MEPSGAVGTERRITTSRIETGVQSGDLERFVPETMAGQLVAAEHLARYHFAAACVEGRDVLDAGCGVGYGSAILAAAGATRVVGVDIALEAVEAARERCIPRADFRVDDLRSLGLPPGSFDVVVCFEAIEHVDDPERVLDELRRVLRPDGLLIVSSPNRDVYTPGNPYHVHEYTTDELESSLKRRFGNVALYLQHAWTASMVTDMSTAGIADTTVELPVSVRKTGRLGRGEEVYTIALASDAEVLPAPGTTVLGEMLEIRAWHEQLERAASDAAAHHRAAEVAWAIETDLRRQVYELGERLMAAEKAAADLLSVRARLARAEEEAQIMAEEFLLAATHAANSSADAAAMRASTSWKFTAPMRWLSRMLRPSVRRAARAERDAHRPS